MTTGERHRGGDRRQSRPGSFDTLHAGERFATDNAWGIPRLAPALPSPVPAWLAPYRRRIRSDAPPDDGAVHFFLDDCRFETVWSRPRKALQALRPFTTLLTPDFSLYRDWPAALQLWNTYRNRWCGCFWQAHGFRVIPTVSWGGAASYAFCFAGVPPRGVVAVSAVGVRLADPLATALFVDGYREMVRRLQPLTVLAYGPLPLACRDLAPVVTYPTRWTTIRAARRAAARLGNGQGR